MNVQWKHGHELAEYAEALGIETKMIMAVHPGEQATVLYTPELDEANLDDPGPIMFARLGRDADGILVVMGEPDVASFDWAAMKANIEAEIERRLGDDRA